MVVDPVVPAGSGSQLAQLTGVDGADVAEEPGRPRLVRHRHHDPVPRDPDGLADQRGRGILRDVLQDVQQDDRVHRNGRQPAGNAVPRDHAEGQAQPAGHPPQQPGRARVDVTGDDRGAQGRQVQGEKAEAAADISDGRARQQADRVPVHRAVARLTERPGRTRPGQPGQAVPVELRPRSDGIWPGGQHHPGKGAGEDLVIVAQRGQGRRERFGDLVVQFARAQPVPHRDPAAGPRFRRDPGQRAPGDHDEPVLVPAAGA